MTTPTDDDKVGTVMREMLRAGDGRGHRPLSPAEVRNRAQHRMLRRVDTKVVVAALAVAAVLVTLITVGPLRSDQRPPSSPLTTQPGGSTTTEPPTTTGTVPAGAASALDAYVAGQSAIESAAATAAGQSFFSGFVSDHSPPVSDDGTVVAVAAFSYDPGGHPVQVLRYAGGRWSLLAGLAAPSDQGGATMAASVVYLTQGPVAVGDVTGDGRPDFLVEAGGADNVPGFVVSQDNGLALTWHYVPFLGPYATPATEVIARDPQFRGTTVVSDYNDCTPDCAGGHNSTLVWTYQRRLGLFTAPYPAGYPGTTTSIP